MNILNSLFRKRDPAPPEGCFSEIAVAPEGVTWRVARPRDAGEPVRASIAVRNGEVGHGDDILRYRAGEHFLVKYGLGDIAPVRRDIFRRTYTLRPDGLFEKRPELRMRFFTLPYAVTVRTLEGARRADAGDWIMEGLAGELWPVAASKAERDYIVA
jgi:hypothetical protein